MFHCTPFEACYTFIWHFAPCYCLQERFGRTGPPNQPPPPVPAGQGDHSSLTNGNGMPPATGHRYSAPAQSYTLPPGSAPPSSADVGRAATLDRSRTPPPQVAPKQEKDKKRHSVLGGFFKKKREKEK